MLVAAFSMSTYGGFYGIRAGAAMRPADLVRSRRWQGTGVNRTAMTRIAPLAVSARPDPTHAALLPALPVRASPPSAGLAALPVLAWAGPARAAQAQAPRV
jgi:hypothetical protein